MSGFLARTIPIGCLVVGLLPAPADCGQDIVLGLTVKDRQRTAYLHVPATLDPRKRYPLVIGYHGGGGNAQGYIRQSKIFIKGERADVIIVCPQGTMLVMKGEHRVWNSGPEYRAATADAEDVAFTEALIREVSARYAVDPKRVYATGFSNGGQMSYRIALELADKIAAIAPMSGGRLADGLRPSRPVPVLHFHGTADGFYPFEGGRGPYSIGRTPHAAIGAVIAQWCKFNGTQLLPESVRHAGWEARRFAGAAEVELILVEEMGHQIAGGADDYLPHQATRDQPDAVSMALEFFAAHPIP